MAITYLDEEPVAGKITYLDDEEQTAAPATVEAPLQTPIETGARSAAKSYMDTIFSPIAGIGGVRQEISNAIGDTAAGWPKAVFDTLTVVPRTIQPIAQEMVDMSRDYFRPDTKLNPKSAVVGGALGQAPLMLAGGMANAAVPLIAGGFSGAGSGLEMADEMGLTSPAARLGLAAAYGGVEGIVERAGAFGNKAAMEALQASARQGAGAVAGQALKSTITEGGEELVTGAAQDSLAANFAPNTYDTSRLNPLTPDMEINPDYVARRGYEALGGAVGGAFFGGAQMLMDRGKAEPTIEGVSDPLAAVAATFAPAAPVAEQPSAVQTPTATPTPTDAQPVPFSPVLQDDLTTIPTTEGDLTTDFAPLQQVTMAPRFRDPNELDPVEVGAGNAFVGLPLNEAAQAEIQAVEEKTARIRAAAQSAKPKQPIIPDAPYGGYDILDFVNDNVIQLPPKADRTTGEYDWAETLNLDPRYNRFLFHSKRGSAIDKVAQRAFEENLISDPTPDALMAAIESTAKNRDDYQREMDAQEQRLLEMEKTIGAPLDSEKASTWAQDVIDSSMETPFIGIDPTLMAAYTVKGAQLIREGFTAFTQWSAEMVKRLGVKVRDYLQGVWQAATKTSQRGSIGGDPLNRQAPADNQESEWADPVLLTHAAEAERLASEGKLPGPTGNQGTVEGWQAEALNRMQQPGAGQALLTDIINSARAHTAVEYFMLEVYAGQLDRQLDEASAVLENPLSNAEERAQAAQQIIAGDIERDRVEIAARLSGSRAGAALGARRFSLERSVIPSLRKMIADVTLLEDPTGKTPLAPETRAQVEKMHADMTAKNAKLEDEKENGTGGAVETYSVELAKLLKEAQEQLAAEKAENARNRAILDEAMKPRPEPVRVSKGVGERIKTAADEARARMRARGIQFSANPMFDVEFIADAAVIMADNIRQGINGAIELVKAFGDEIKPFLNQIRDKAEIMIRDEAKRKSPEDIKAKAKQRVADGKGTPADLARQLALSHIADHLDRKDATMSAEKIAELVRADLQEIQPGITTRQARDLISGYGKSTTPSQEASKQIMRDYRAQMQKLTQIEALRAGEKLLKSGPQRDEPSPRQRELTKLLEELKRETGYQSRTREDELKGIRDRIKKGLENQIEDLKLILAGKAKPTSERERVAYDAEMQAMQTLRNKLKTLVEEMPQHKLATEERRNRAAKAAALASEAEWKRRAAAKEWNSKGKIEGPNTQDVQAAKDKAAAARADFIALKKAANPGYDPEARELAAFKRRLQKQINVLNERIAKEDFEAKKKTPRQQKHDEQSAKLEMELNESKRKFIDLKVKKRWERMGIVGKAVENSRRSLYFMRAIMAGGEFSAIGRQGILKALSHPVKFLGDLKAMTKAFKSAAGEQQLMSDLWKRENATNGIYKRSGLALHNPTDYSELLAEGAARSALSDKIPWFSHTARAYTGLLNNMRADMLDMLIEKRSRNGQEELSDSTLKALAGFVNDSTGSGKLGFGKYVLQGTARDVASALMFSPSFFMSRLRLLTGASAWGADKRTVAVIGTEYAKIAAGYTALYALLGALQDAGEDELEKDARSGGFLKMDFGKTSVDLMAGLSQMAVFLTRMITGETKSRGEIVPIRGEKRKFNAPDVPGVIWRFMRSKESPQAGLMLDALTGEDSLGNPVNFSKSDQWARSAKEMVTPMTGRAIADILTEEPAPRAAALSAAAMIGIGTNTRKPTTK